jgi:hypothetical protein
LIAVLAPFAVQITMRLADPGRFCHQFVPFFASFCSQLAHRLIVYDEDRFAAARLNARIGVLYLGKSQQSSDSSADPATSPCIRVRTRRFERLR